MRNDYDLEMKWNDRLKQAFESAVLDRGITQTDFAKACGVSSASASDWLSGETKNIEARFLIPACKFLKISPFWVMLGDETDYDFGQIAASEQINAIDVIRLVALFSQTADDGRAKLLAAADETKRLFPRR